MLVSIMTMSEAFPEIWTDFRVPTNIDRDTVIESIKIGCAEMSLLYSDPDILKYIIKVWTNREFPVWAELQKTLEYQYNPIWNVEGSEKHVITRSNNEERDVTDGRTMDVTGTRTPNVSVTQNVAGFNDSTLATKERSDETGTETLRNAGTDSTRHAGYVKNTGLDTDTFTRGMNIGVKSTQELIKEQRDLVQFTVTEFIYNSFKTNFCLMVY